MTPRPGAAIGRPSRRPSCRTVTPATGSSTQPAPDQHSGSRSSRNPRRSRTECTSTSRSAEAGRYLWQNDGREWTREEITARYRRAWEHSDTTITALPIDAPGHVPWWPRPNVKLFNILVHVLTETSRHAGHADILREQLDGSVGE